MSIIEHARAELRAVNMEERDGEILIEIMDRFFQTWDSGGAVSVMIPVLIRLMEGKPLTPLTGKADEWVIHNFDDDAYAQNRRCGIVFQRRDGSAYILSPTNGRVEIRFPFYPPDDDRDIEKVASRSKIEPFIDPPPVPFDKVKAAFDQISRAVGAYGLDLVITPEGEYYVETRPQQEGPRQ